MQSNTGATPLILAAGGGHVDTMKILLRQPKVDTSKCSHELTIMHKAVESGKAECVQLLLDYSVDCDVPTIGRYCGMDALIHPGLTPLMIACDKGYSAITEMLLKHGADPLATDVELETPMYLAVKHNRYSCLELLLESGLDVDGVKSRSSSKDEGEADPEIVTYRDCPLTVAIKENSLQCLHMLLQHGCRTNRIVLNRSDTPVSPFEFGLLEGRVAACLMLLYAAPPPAAVNVAALQEGMARLAHSDEELFEQVLGKLKNVQTLMDICRWVIRQSLGKATLSSITKLPLPTKIQAFLNLDHLQDIYK